MKLTKLEIAKISDLLESTIKLLGDVRATLAGVAREPGAKPEPTWRVPTKPPKPRKPTRRRSPRR
jgi:hypothetical protein